MPAPRSRPELLQLGERTLPGTGRPLPVPDVGGLPAVVASHPLHGSGTGTYVGPEITIDAGTSFRLTGTAHLDGLGSFTVSGWVQGVGMIASGRATGELVLSSARGTITLALHGRVQTAFSQPPTDLVYTVTSTTGRVGHLNGYGVVGMHRIPAPTAFGQPPRGIVNLSFS